MNLTKLLTGRFLGRNYAWQTALRRTAFLDVPPFTLRLIGGGRGGQLSCRRPIFPSGNSCSPRSGDDRGERISSGVASAVFCLHDVYALVQSPFTSKCTAFQ
jgi:hypothetical protein